jgi:hypothetical protein
MGSLFDEINKTMGEFGFSEKIGATAQFPLILKLSGVRLLTMAERGKVAALVLDDIQKQFPAYRLQLNAIEPVSDDYATDP